MTCDLYLFRTVAVVFAFHALVEFCDAGQLNDQINGDALSHQVTLPPRTDDSTFLRRVFLDSIGRIPTTSEARAFLTSASPSKREELIDSLLNSDGYSKRWFHFWADLLRLSTDGDITRSGIVGAAYSQWLRTALDDNLPYDQFVRDLVGSQGNIWEPEHAGTVGFYERDFGMPLDHFSNLMRVFAGTRMECAQCHNHPFDQWTQMDFYRMAAFTHSVRAGKYPAIYEAIKEPERTAINTITIPMRFGSVLPRYYPLRLPHDYAYDDAKPLQEISTRTAFGEIVETSGTEPGNAVFARWLTSPKNPRFTRVIVNRLWQELFGAPLVPLPLDDLRDGTKAVNPGLEQALIELMISENYDLRKFLGTVMKSEAYQRRVQVNGPPLGMPPSPHAPLLRRMRAEQVWDSLVALIVDDPDRIDLQKELYRVRYLGDLRNRAAKISGTPEAVVAWLGTGAGKEFVASRGKETVPELERQLSEIAATQAESKKRTEAVWNSSLGTKSDFTNWRAIQNQLYRASELGSPAPRGHFLRTFGQSDREMISNSSDDATVPQALAIFNDELTEAVGNPFSKLSRDIVESVDSANHQLDSLFLGLFARFPIESEREKFAEMMNSKGGRQNLIAALLMTSRFQFIE